eukprot:5517602-Lingulodinium_polyedra.AAC.1
MRSNPRVAAAAACAPHARALHARTEKWPAHGTRKRGTREPLWSRTADSTASLRSFQTLRKNASKSAFRRRG